MAKTRKYYRITATRICPYAAFNGSYRIEEDVYAYSEEGARDTFVKYHAKGFGSHIAEEIKEISKDEFRGHHETNLLNDN